MFDCVTIDLDLLSLTKKEQEILKDEVWQSKDFTNSLAGISIKQDEILINRSNKEILKVLEGTYKIYTTTGTYKDNTFKWWEFLITVKEGQVVNVIKSKD